MRLTSSRVARPSDAGKSIQWKLKNKTAYPCVPYEDHNLIHASLICVQYMESTSVEGAIVGLREIQSTHGRLQEKHCDWSEGHIHARGCGCSLERDVVHPASRRMGCLQLPKGCVGCRPQDA